MCRICRFSFVFAGLAQLDWFDFLPWEEGSAVVSWIGRGCADKIDEKRSPLPPLSLLASSVSSFPLKISGSLGPPVTLAGAPIPSLPFLASMFLHYDDAVPPDLATQSYRSCPAFSVVSEYLHVASARGELLNSHHLRLGQHVQSKSIKYRLAYEAESPNGTPWLRDSPLARRSLNGTAVITSRFSRERKSKGKKTIIHSLNGDVFIPSFTGLSRVMSQTLIGDALNVQAETATTMQFSMALQLRLRKDVLRTPRKPTPGQEVSHRDSPVWTKQHLNILALPQPNFCIVGVPVLPIFYAASTLDCARPSAAVDWFPVQDAKHDPEIQILPWKARMLLYVPRDGNIAECHERHTGTDSENQNHWDFRFVAHLAESPPLRPSWAFDHDRFLA
ncbi:hypothetical protein ACRALDRAFT_209457 [Sodiomyces alcalophilus JCM 7366]|uniref:uncharacterized protein n=1 Tax=Sodiomyces alcalophilus JCM 7366 TaxID=591952 RepID=UPI0039B46B48